MTTALRALRRVLAGQPLAPDDLAALRNHVRELQGKRKSAREVKVARLALMLRLIEFKKLTREHAAERALECYPGQSISTVRDHLNAARPASMKLLRLATVMHRNWCEDNALLVGPEPAKTFAQDDFLGQ